MSEREALAELIWTASIEFSNPHAAPPVTKWGDVPTSAARQSARYAAEKITAAGFHREPCPVTDEMVEAAGSVLYANWEEFDFSSFDMDRGIQELVRTALEAALTVRPEDVT